jgi:hypothetical protein
MNAEGYGIHKEIRREAKEIQNELANMNLDGWVGNLVTAMEEIDFTDVVVRRENVAIEIPAGGIARSPGRNGSRISAACTAARAKGWASRTRKKMWDAAVTFCTPRCC